ncbi:hypothetical protein Hanom_Chr03g00267081 [Helianthus anomalus]
MEGLILNQLRSEGLNLHQEPNTKRDKQDSQDTDATDESLDQCTYGKDQLVSYLQTYFKHLDLSLSGQSNKLKTRRNL